MFNTDDITLPKVKCYGKVSVVKNKGTVYEMALCDDCANNGEQRLTKRALDKWRALGWVDGSKKPATCQ